MLKPIHLPYQIGPSVQRWPGFRLETFLRDERCVLDPSALCLLESNPRVSCTAFCEFTLPFRVAGVVVRDSSFVAAGPRLSTAGVDVAADKLDACWTITPQFEAAAAAAAKLDVKKATGDDVRKVLASNGAGDLFPQLDPAETAKITKEGKIPVYASWRDRVRAGTASWDGILTAAALASFAQDQQALDDRIRKQL